MLGLFSKKPFEFTSPFNPKLEIQTEGDAKKYVARLSATSRREDLFVELANVMAAKYNLMSHQYGQDALEPRQKLVTELTDKATWICLVALGAEAVFGYAGNDLRRFNMLVSEVDNEVAEQDLEPEQHGAMMLAKLRKRLGVSP